MYNVLESEVINVGITDFSKLFARNLNNALISHGKTQSDLVRDLHFSKATVSSWCNGTRVPRPDKMDEICNYLNIRRSDLMEEKPSADFVLTSGEIDLVIEYRNTDEATRQSIKNLLEYSKIIRMEEKR